MLFLDQTDCLIEPFSPSLLWLTCLPVRKLLFLRLLNPHIVINPALMAENSYKVSWGWGEQGLQKAAPEQPFLLWPELGTSQQCGPGDAPPSAESAGVMPDLQPHIHCNTCSSPSGFWLCRLETGWAEAAGESEGKPRQCWLHRAGSCCPIRCSLLSLQCDISKSRAKCTESRTWSYCFRRGCLWEPVSMIVSWKQK